MQHDLPWTMPPALPVIARIRLLALCPSHIFGSTQLAVAEISMATPNVETLNKMRCWY